MVTTLLLYRIFSYIFLLTCDITQIVINLEIYHLFCFRGDSNPAYFDTWLSAILKFYPRKFVNDHFDARVSASISLHLF